jgi:hypothetical protein
MQRSLKRHKENLSVAHRGVMAWQRNVISAILMPKIMQYQRNQLNGQLFINGCRNGEIIASAS